jgi:hypothetical protein
LSAKSGVARPSQARSTRFARRTSADIAATSRGIVYYILVPKTCVAAWVLFYLDYDDARVMEPWFAARGV